MRTAYEGAESVPQWLSLLVSMLVLATPALINKYGDRKKRSRK